MFDTERAACAESAAARLTELVRQLQGCAERPGDADGAELITCIGLLETLKSVASAVQAELTARFAATRQAELDRLDDAAARDRVRRDIGAQIGLARRVSPRLGSRLAGLAGVLTAEMPCLMGALRAGVLDEYQALLVAGETATLSREHRGEVDRELATRYGTMNPAQARGAAARIGYRLDPEQATARTRRAVADRRVTLRPAPDTMTYLTALLPVADGVTAYAALNRHAATATASGDRRGRGALMADTLVARLLQPETPSTATAPDEDGLPALPSGVGVEIQLLMTDRTLFDGDAEPAVLTGFGAVPAPLARHLVRTADARTRIWVRRLYTDPATDLPIGGDPRRRFFAPTARRLLVARDQTCRTPWCGAPIQHADHTVPHAAGGSTELANGSGRCTACNQIKELPGWTAATAADGEIVTTTPTGHRYRSRPPAPPVSSPWPEPGPLRTHSTSTRKSDASSPRGRPLFTRRTRRHPSVAGPPS